MGAHNQVKVASLEVLESFALRLGTAGLVLGECCDESVREASANLERAEAELDEAIRGVERASDNVCSCQNDIEWHADDGSEGDGESGEDDDGIAEAIDALGIAESELVEAEQALELARDARNRAALALAKVSAGAFVARSHLDGNLVEGITHLSSKVRNLMDYLLEHPELAGASKAGADAYSRSWVSWKPSDRGVLKWSVLSDRFALPKDSLPSLAGRWAETDTSFSRQISTLRERYASAGSEQELEAVRLASRRGASGRLGELIAENALSPFATSVELQRRTTTVDEAGITVTDLVLRGMRIPINVGNLRIPSGADVSIEVKCGEPAYLRQQLAHMQRQVSGHRGEQASFCFLSKDFHRLSRASKHEIALALGKERSKIYALLPEKSTLDSLVWEQITRN